VGKFAIFGERPKAKNV